MGLKRISDKEYFSTPAISASGLKEFAKSPAHYKAYLSAPSVSKKCFDIGHASHSSILEGEKTYVLFEQDLRSKEAKAKYAALKEAGEMPLKQKEIDIVEGMTKSVKAHKIGGLIGRNPERSELAGFVEDPETGLLLKAKFDYAPSSGNLIFDLKTARDASPYKFKWSIRDMGYDIQAAHYLYVSELLGLPYEQFVFIAVEKTAPYAVGAYMLDSESLDKAKNKHRLLLSSYRECLDADDFTACYSQDIEMVTI